jgi:hypothetical protein
MSTASADNTAVLQFPQPSARDVDTVPYVELINDRLQGVVSSGSDPARVYCAFVEAGGDHYSSTNNNRPDAGTPKRISWLTKEAVRQFGDERVARCLQIPAVARLHLGRRKQEPAGVVFSRFLNYLRFVELQAAPGPVPEMSWFVSK